VSGTMIATSSIIAYGFSEMEKTYE